MILSLQWINIYNFLFTVGRYNAHDIANFVKESDLSNVRVLHPENFPNLKDLKDNWFIDFFAPVRFQFFRKIPIFICRILQEIF